MASGIVFGTLDITNGDVWHGNTISFHVGAEDACVGILAECRKNGRDLKGRPIRFSVVFA